MIHQAVGMTEPAEAAHHLTQHPQPGLATRICRDDPLARMAETGDVIYRGGRIQSAAAGPWRDSRAISMSYCKT